MQKYNPHLPNEAHRKARWSRALIIKNRKQYSRKKKHKSKED